MEVKIKLKIKDVEIELTTKETAELVKTLTGLVGMESKIIEKHHEYHPYHPWWPYEPYKIKWEDSSHVWLTSDRTMISDDISVSYSVQ